MAGLNKNNAGVKRIMQEAKELANDPSTDYSAAPLEDDIFEWHCTLRGPKDTEFEGGLYHFRIVLPAEYPFRPPSIMILTPNGRFELNTKICISFTNYHEELWQPAWGVRTAIIGLQGFFPLKGQAAVGVGSVEYPASERRRLAQASRSWVCPHCQQSNADLLPDPPEGSFSGEKPASEIAPSDTPTMVPVTTPSPPPQSSAAAAVSTTTIIDGDASATPTSSRPNLSHTDGQRGSGALPTESSSSPDNNPSTTMVGSSLTMHSNNNNDNPSPKIPLLLDTTIGVLVILLLALVCRKIL